MMMATKDKEQLAYLKREINGHKSRLMDIARQIEKISPKQADQLNSIIGRLEAWQNK